MRLCNMRNCTVYKAHYLRMVLISELNLAVSMRGHIYHAGRRPLVGEVIFSRFKSRLTRQMGLKHGEHSRFSRLYVKRGAT